MAQAERSPSRAQIFGLGAMALAVLVIAEDFTALWPCRRSSRGFDAVIVTFLLLRGGAMPGTGFPSAPAIATVSPMAYWNMRGVETIDRRRGESMGSKSLTGFNDQLDPVGQLIAIHGKLQTGRGRRHEQDAIHRAGVVMIVAAWQAYVEKVLVEGLDAIAVDIDNPAVPAPNWAKHTYKMRRASLLNAIRRFNTPDDVNVRDLFLEESFAKPGRL